MLKKGKRMLCAALGLTCVVAMMPGTVLASETIQSEQTEETNASTVTEEKSVESDSSESVNYKSEDDLLYEPVYGCNPVYEKWTTVSYTEAEQTFIATVSASADDTVFELECNFFQADQAAVATYDGETVEVLSDLTGFAYMFTQGVIETALEQNVWVSTEESSLEYDDLFGKREQEQQTPAAIRTGVWDEEFERSNDVLNLMTSDIEDETLVAYKTTEASLKGTIVEFEYETKDYTSGAQTAITQMAYVYLPAGYDESKEYNILYLLHGGGGYAAQWFSQSDDADNAGDACDGYAVNILDHMMENGDCEPCIVVTPTINTNGLEYFYHEFEDLIGAVESKYSTYADDVSEESLIASRSHRGFAGLSMGSMTTWYTMLQEVDIVGNYACMSAAVSADETEAVEFVNEKVWPTLAEWAEKGYTLDLWLHFNGVDDMALNNHVLAHQELCELMSANDSFLKVGENYDFIVSEGGHSFPAWNMDLYDVMLTFFHGESDAPNIDDSNVEDPTIDEPTTDNPVVEDPATDAPAVDEPDDDTSAVKDKTPAQVDSNQNQQVASSANQKNTSGTGSNTKTAGTNQSTTSSPKTGDEASIPAGLAALVGIAAAVAIIAGRKKEKSF